MRISQEIGTGNLHPWIPVPPSHEADGSSFMQDAPSLGPPNFNLKSRCLLPRPSTSPCHRHYVTSFPLWPTTGNEGAELQGCLYQTLCLLQGIWRRCGSPKTCEASKATPKDQAHQCLLSSLLQHVQKELIKIFHINTKDQIADTLTKALAQNDFQCHCPHLCGA